jgi:hypothetical protein
MGCLNVNIRDECKHLQVGCSSLNSLLQVEARRICACLDVSCRLVKSILRADVQLQNSLLRVSYSGCNVPLQASALLICSVNDNYFLYVEPDVVWITEGMLSGEFEIVSNVSWKIE